MISRDLYEKAPRALLAPHTEPATGLKDLSPADRVFGWVNQEGKGSHKGQLRIGTVECLDGPAAVERVVGDEGVVLAILGQPKPSQARFYAARSPKGEPLTPGTEKKDAYNSGGGLRGRKVYPHQGQTAQPGYWDAGTEHAQPLVQRWNGQEIFREWQSHDATRNDQNRSVTAWVRPRIKFRCRLEVSNLNAAELGALLWLLTLDDGLHLRLGGGKPLGFGSVRIQATGLDLSTGAALAEDYRAFGKRQAAAGARIVRLEDRTGVVTAYQDALPAALGEPGTAFEQLEVIRAFKNAARASQHPVHYPRTAAQQAPGGENFKWFVANENKGPRTSLPALYNPDRGLPELEET